MQANIAQKLIDLNLRFYQSFAQSFSETRGRLQPGVLRVLETIPNEASILDLGCGNGELASELAKRGHKGSYLGLDFSEELLNFARKRVNNFIQAKFALADLTSPQFNHHPELTNQPFDFLVAFATLHHIPSRALRLKLLTQVHDLLAPKGQFIHSNWQFLNSERLRARIQDWALVELTAEDVAEGDYLLDWRREGQGLRYVHHFSAGELEELATASGFEVVETFSSDGESGDLGLYQIWQPR